MGPKMVIPKLHGRLTQLHPCVAVDTNEAKLASPLLARRNKIVVRIILLRIFFALSAAPCRSRSSSASVIVLPPPMAAPITASRSPVSPASRVQVMCSMLNRTSASFSRQTASFPSIRLRPVPNRFQALSCSAKQDTIDKVCEIVKNQLAVDEGTTVSGETKFVDLGADSLDTVEIVMGLEEAFQITVDESSAQVIQTVEDAAGLIDKLVAEKDA